MILILFFLGTLVLANPTLPHLPLDGDLVASVDKEPFLPHEGPGRFDNWLAVNLRFAPIDELRRKIEAIFQVQLKHRGEAHVTVITPPEFWTLGSVLKMSEINAMAEKKIQKTKLKPLCLGRGEAYVGGKMQTTFFVVVQSDELLQLRLSIGDLFQKKGGKPEQFNAHLYFPHITVGYTERDLHWEDGIRKDVRSCVATLAER